MRRSYTFMAIAVMVNFLLVLAFPIAAEQKILELLKAMERRVEGVRDYTAVFHKQEVVKGKLLPQENIAFKFRKPFSVYMRWLEGPHKGREVLYVRDKNKGKLIGHEGGFFGFVTLSLNPKGRQAMKGNRYPITEAGISKLVTRVLKDVKKGKAEGVLQVANQQTVELYGKRSRMLTLLFPNDPKRGFSAPKMNLWIDPEHGLPIKVEFFDWELRMVESYGYKDLRLNLGLTDYDFDRDNKSYGF